MRFLSVLTEDFDDFLKKLFFQPSRALRIYEFIYSEGPLPTKIPM